MRRIDERQAEVDMRAHAVRHHQAARDARWAITAGWHRLMALWHEEIAARLARRHRL